MAETVLLGRSHAPGPRPGLFPLPFPPLALEAVCAGFPSPAADYEDAPLDLNERLVDNPEATYFVRVSGDSMLGAGIHDGDVLVVDRAVDPAPGKVVVAAVGGEFTVKRLAARAGRVLLLPENPDYPELDVTEREDFELFGVVRHVIHSL